MKTAAFVIDDWKLPIFKRHLDQAGYAFENAGAFTAGTTILKVETDNLEALATVARAAAKEAAQTGGQTTCQTSH